MSARIAGCFAEYSGMAALLSVGLVGAAEAQALATFAILAGQTVTKRRKFDRHRKYRGEPRRRCHGVSAGLSNCAVHHPRRRRCRQQRAEPADKRLQHSGGPAIHRRHDRARPRGPDAYGGGYSFNIRRSSPVCSPWMRRTTPMRSSPSTWRGAVQGQGRHSCRRRAVARSRNRSRTADRPRPGGVARQQPQRLGAVLFGQRASGVSLVGDADRMCGQSGASTKGLRRKPEPLA